MRNNQKLEPLILPDLFFDSKLRQAKKVARDSEHCGVTEVLFVAAFALVAMVIAAVIVVVVAIPYCLCYFC